MFWKYYLFVKLAYFVNSYVKLTAGWSFRITYQPVLSQTIAPNALTWFLKELLTTVWRPWKAFYSKTILLGLHKISVFILSVFYWQCIFDSIVTSEIFTNSWKKWFASQQPLKLLRLHLPCYLVVSWHHLLCLKSGPFEIGMIVTSYAVKNWRKMPIVFHHPLILFLVYIAFIKHPFFNLRIIYKSYKHLYFP